MQKAVIQNGKVINLISYDEEVGIQGMRFRRDQSLFDCTSLSVQIGDDFADGVFCRDGEPVPRVDPDAPTYEEMAEALEILGVPVSGGGAE